MPCPRCCAEHTVKHGRSHHGQATRLCTDCRRPVVPDATQTVISPQTWERLDTLLLEKLPLAGMARVVDLAAEYLPASVNRQSAAVPRELQRRAPTQAS
jgi:transposase-like protein